MRSRRSATAQKRGRRCCCAGRDTSLRSYWIRLNLSSTSERTTFFRIYGRRCSARGRCTRISRVSATSWRGNELEGLHRRPHGRCLPDRLLKSKDLWPGEASLRITSSSFSTWRRGALPLPASPDTQPKLDDTDGAQCGRSSPLMRSVDVVSCCMTTNTQVSASLSRRSWPQRAFAASDLFRPEVRI